MAIQLSSLSSAQLRRAAGLQEKISALNIELTKLLGASISTSKPSVVSQEKSGMSPAGRAKVAVAQKARWAKVKAVKPAKATPKRKMSAAGRAKIAAAAKARWAKAKAAGKTSL